MGKFIKDKVNIVLCVVIIVLTIVMTIYENKKEGFNEDEIFSYGSSNYALDNLYQPYGEMDTLNKVIIKYVLKDNWISNIFYYINNTNEFMETYNYEMYTDPIWKTREEAKDYLTISKDEVFNYISVIWNQSRDVHPPLFYVLVHLVSSLFLGHFTKYIIFIINIVFFILTCIVICRIFKLYNNKKLAVYALIMYGLSMGAISTVMFQRMYMMLTFWIVLYIYISLKITRKGMSKQNIIQLGIVTILGFLTQYYFCIFAVVIFGILLIHLKDKKKWISENIKLGLLGVIIFPACIYHIFFSYRGVKALQDNYFERLKFFIEETFREFSINTIGGYIIIVLALIGFIYFIITNRKNKRLTEYLIFTLPLILYYIIISKNAPYLEQRYILPVLPVIVIALVMLVYYYIRKIKVNKKVGSIICIILILGVQGYGLIAKEPDYLYKGYNEYTELAYKYKDYQFIYVGINQYNHIKNMPEFCIYKESLILNQEQLELLKKREVEDKFVLCIKNYLSIEDVLNKVMENTNSTKYELIMQGKAVGYEANYYLLSK